MSNGAADLALLRLSADIVSAHVSHNAITASGLPEFIRSVHAALLRTGRPDEPSVSSAQRPAVPIKKSVFPGYLICLEDGKKLKMLKRHLQASYGMTPEQYRARWDLPASYPMVAPDYAAHRSELAKKVGLGRKAAPVEVAPPQVATKTRKRSKKLGPAPSAGDAAA